MNNFNYSIPKTTVYGGPLVPHNIKSRRNKKNSQKQK